MACLLYLEKKCFRLHLNESTEFQSERKGKVIYVDGPKTEKTREPTVESLVPGIWRLRVSEDKGEEAQCNVM